MASVNRSMNPERATPSGGIALSVPDRRALAQESGDLDALAMAGE
jgi:hypothetical protein